MNSFVQKVFPVAKLSVTVLALVVAGCAAGNPTSISTTTESTAATTSTVDVLPPAVNEAIVIPAPVSRLHPGMQIAVGGDTDPRICTAGFYVEFPAPDNPRQRIGGFLTGAQCARGDVHASVSIMKIEAGGLAPSRTKIGEIAYLAQAGGEPSATPQSDLAIFSCGTEDPGLPVDVEVNGEPQTTDTVQAVGAAQRQQASVAWSSSAGVIERGHVIDPAALPEARLPADTDRVVIAADDPTKAIDEHLLGSPVTAEIGSSTRNLGIVTAIDSGRRWIVVELIDRFLSDRRARLVVGS